MGLYVDTTGTTEAIPDLGITLTHPTTDYPMSEQFSGERLKESSNLTALILAGTLAWKKTAAGTIQPAGDYDPDIVEIDESNLGPGLQADRAVTFKDLTNLIATSASPGFTWGKSGNVSANTWLLNESVPSDKAGRLNFLYNAYIDTVFVSNELPNTFNLQIYEHDGTTYTLLTTVSLVALRAKSFALGTSITVTKDKELAVKLVAGSGKNVVCGLLIKGSLTP